VRIALAQFDFPVGDLSGNSHRIFELIERSRDEAGADLILFPELALCGYPPEDLLLRPAFLAECQQRLQDIAANVHGIVAVVGWPEAAGAVVFNAASALRNGRVEATYRKRELPNYAVFDERRYFAADTDSCVFEVAGVQVGLLICEDLWFPEPTAAVAQMGAQLVVVPNASPFERDKSVQRDALLAQRARESGVGIAYLNVVGGQDELVFDGASDLIDGDGGTHPSTQAFNDALLIADFDPVTRKFTRGHWPIASDESGEALAWAAIVRGIRDYCSKNGFKRAWLGLSGGIDSALVLALAAEALGPSNVTAVRLPSRYTAGLSNDLADVQARKLGVEMLTVPIAEPFEGFLRALAPAFEGRAPDVAEENLQSRSRGVLLMALSNKLGGLLLTTGNKSEYAVGYATIYGDMCGGFAPIKDLYKTEVYALCRWRNAQGDGEIIPEGVITRAPSAELRENQTDQDSLPPYEVLDGILARYIDQEAAPADIVLDGFDPATVRRVLTLVRQSEWKRRQAAPGPKLSRRAFGRERRYPITSGWRD
jgi:NAD+ synthetase